MRLPRWKSLRSVRRRPDLVRRKLHQSTQLALRRLEERRVLDVSAAFLATTGELQIDLSQAGDTANVAHDHGQIVITDQDHRQVDIAAGSAGPRSVMINDVQRLDVRGSTAPDQTFALNTFLVPERGLRIDGQLERVELNQSVTRVERQGIQIAASEIELAANLEASGLEIVLGGNVILADDVTLTAGTVLLGGTVDDDGLATTGSSLRINAEQATTITSAIGGAAAIDGLQTDSIGITQLGGDITTVGNTLVFNDPVALISSVSLTDAGGGIYFRSTVDSAAGARHSLSVSAAGRIAFDGDLGTGNQGDQSLGGLTVGQAAGGVFFGEQTGIRQIHVSGPIDIGTFPGGIGGGGIVFNSGLNQLLTVSTMGSALRLNGPAVLRTDVSLTTAGGDILFTAASPIDSGANAVRQLTIDAGSGLVSFNEDIGAMVPLSGLTIVQAGGGVMFGGADVKHGADGPVQLLRATGPIEIGRGGNEIGGRGVVFNAGAGTFSIETTGDRIRINGPVTVSSGLAIDTGPSGGDILFTSTASLDSQAFETNDISLNAGRGAVFFNGDLGAAAALGQLRILAAAGGVVFGDADRQTGPGGAGPVNTIYAAAGLDVGLGSNTVGGAGIVLNGGSRALEMRTDGGQIRLNGATTLGSAAALRTGSGLGDIVFTSDTRVDSRLGETNDLVLDAGAGQIRVNADLGREQRLGALRIARAAGGLFLGESLVKSGVPGSTGPVELIHTDRDIDLGTGTNVIAGGIVFTGGSIGGLTIRTGGEAVRVNGPAHLATDLFIDTGSGDGDILFTNDTPLDSLAGRVSNLNLAAGQGRISLNEDLGGLNPLGAFTVLRADGGVVLGGASHETPGSGGLGPVNLIRTERNIDLGSGTNIIGGQGIVLNGGEGTLSVETSGDDIRLNGPVVAQSGVSFDTDDGRGDLIFTSVATLDSGDGPELTTALERNEIQVDVGDGGVFFNADLGARQRLGGLTADRAAKGIVFGQAETQTVEGWGPVTQVLTTGPIDLGTGSGLDNIILGGIVFNAGSGTLHVQTEGQDIRLNGPVELRSDVVWGTGPASGDLTLTEHAPLDGSGLAASRLVVALGGGDAVFFAAIGAKAALAELRFDSLQNLDLHADSIAGRLVQAAGSGTSTFHARLRTSDPAQSGVELTGTHFAFHQIVQTDGDGRLIIHHSGLLDIKGSAGFELNGSFRETGGGRVRTAGGILTSGDAIQFAGQVTVGGGANDDVQLDTTGRGFSGGSQVRFESTLDGEQDGQDWLGVNAGTAGRIVFAGPVGRNVRLGSIEIINAQDVELTQSVRVGNIVQQAGQGATSFGGAIDTNSGRAALGIDLNTVDVRLHGAVTTSGVGGVEISVGHQLTIDDGADMLLGGPFLQNGGGSVAVLADLVTSGHELVFLGDTEIGDSVRFDTGGGLAGDIRFARSLNATADGLHNVVLAAGEGDLHVAGPVGFRQDPNDSGALITSGAPAELVIETARDATFLGPVRVGRLIQLAGTGATRFDGPVIVSAAPTAITVPSVAIHTQDVIVNASLNTSGGAIRITAMNDVLLGDQSSWWTAGASVWIRADADPQSPSPNYDPDADAGQGGAVLMANGATITTGAGRIDIIADEEVRLGRLRNETVIRLESISGQITDGGDAGGADLETHAAALWAARGIGSQDQLDTLISVLAARNRLEGGLRLFNDSLDLLTIGDVDGLSGVVAGPAIPTNLAAVAASDIEITNRGALQIGSHQRHDTSHVPSIVADAMLNFAGGDTILRSGPNSSLTIHAPINNRGGDGWIVLFSGQDLVLNDSLPEFTVDGTLSGTPLAEPEGGLPVAMAELSVEHRGAIRGEAGQRVVIDTGTDVFLSEADQLRGIASRKRDYAIVRTHAERFPFTGVEPERPASYTEIPSREYLASLPHPPRTAAELLQAQRDFLEQVQEQLKAVRNTISPQATQFPGIISAVAVDQGGSTVDERGRVYLQITVGDIFYSETNWHITVNWGDGTIDTYTVPSALTATLGFRDSRQTLLVSQPNATVQGRFDSGVLQSDGTRASGVFFAHHTYSANPTPGNPADLIPVIAELRYDARAEGELEFDQGRSVGSETGAGFGEPSAGSGIFNGIRFFEFSTQEMFASDTAFFQNPGASQIVFLKVFESVIVPVEGRQVSYDLTSLTTTTFVASSGSQFGAAAVTFEAETFGDFQLILKIFDEVAGAERADEYLLPLDVLEDPIGLFTKRFRFPDGQYRIYLEEIRTRRRRLIIEVNVFQGRVVPPNFREAAGERQPGSSQPQPEPSPRSDVNSAGDSRLEDSSQTERPGADEVAAQRAHEAAVVKWSRRQRERVEPVPSPDVPTRFERSSS